MKIREFGLDSAPEKVGFAATMDRFVPNFTVSEAKNLFFRGEIGSSGSALKVEIGGYCFCEMQQVWGKKGGFGRLKY